LDGPRFRRMTTPVNVIDDERGAFEPVFTVESPGKSQSLVRGRAVYLPPLHGNDRSSTLGLQRSDPPPSVCFGSKADVSHSVSVEGGL
jgi:hypothetical protein